MVKECGSTGAIINDGKTGCHDKPSSLYVTSLLTLKAIQYCCINHGYQKVIANLKSL